MTWPTRNYGSVQTSIGLTADRATADGDVTVASQGAAVYVDQFIEEAA
jgi:hypothetical protein